MGVRKINNDFICIQTFSGYASCRADYLGAKNSLSRDAADNEVGEALLDALSKSRFVLPAPRENLQIDP